MRRDGDLTRLDAEAFALFASPDAVYVRAAPEVEGKAYALCAADGRVLAVTQARELAFAVARQNGLDPESVH